MSTEVVLSISGKVLDVPLQLNMYIGGAPFSLQLTTAAPISINGIWETISQALYNASGLSLPDLTNGPWSKFLRLGGVNVAPSLWITPGGTSGNFSAYLELDFGDTPVHIGGSKKYGPVTITLEPDISIEALYISYDKGAGGFDFKAKIAQPTQGASVSSPAGSTGKIVSYPFPIPSQGSVPVFKLNYLGLGQRVGPKVVVSGNDPMATIFQQLETDLIGNDPVHILTNLANNFYQPDRGWFIAADISFRGFQLRVIFNDPTIYGLELTAGADTPLAGLLFEILYQKLGPNLGVYYGALTLPMYLRRIVLDGVILILPGFSIWVYTNGDFKVNIGWPLGSNSIGIQVGVLVGQAGFYFARLRSADNPGAQPTVNYNPILEFGIGISVFVQESYTASIFTATISVSLTCTFQGLLAWYAGSSPNASASLAKPPDHYWFAGTASLSVLIQGSVSFAILKASVTISLVASVSVAFETGYLTVVAVSASVSVEVSVHVLFFTVHLSFSAQVSHNFYIGSGSTAASINGPLDPNLAPFGPNTLLMQAEVTRSQAILAAHRLIAATVVPRSRIGLLVSRMPAAAQPVTIDVHFVLQPTAVFTSPATVDLIASLFIETPVPNSSPGSGEPFVLLIQAMVNWLLTYSQTGDAYSQRFQDVVNELGSGSQFGSSFGSWEGFALAFRTFVETSLIFNIHGVGSGSPNPPETFAAILPMIDALTLNYTGASGPQTIQFDLFNPTPADYPEAVNFYFDELSWSGPAGPANTISGLWQQAPGSPLETPSMCAYLFFDYFLMQCRNVAGQLLTAAQAYENNPTDEFLANVEAARARGETDPWHFTDLAMDFRAQVTGSPELDTLLAQFDYVSAGGLGSRYLLHGLQLPDPSQIPAQPTPANMAGVPTDGIYVLTGQQFSLPGGSTTASATLSVSPAQSWVVFDTGAGSTATITGLPGTVPPPPSSQWSGTNLAANGSANGEIDLNPLLPLSAQPLYYAMKSQLAWTSPQGPCTILPLPVTLPANGTQLAISTAAPGSAQASPGAEVPASGGLLISLSISQLPSNAGTNVGPAGSPASGSGDGSPGPSGPVQYLPNVYQVNGTDEATRDLLQTALEGDLKGATITLLYTLNGALVSETLGENVLIAKTNLSTINQAPQVAMVFAQQLAAFQETFEDVTSAPISNVGGFLSLIWEVSVVNAAGFFLYYITETGQDLPGSLFSDAGVGGGQTAQFDILVTFGQQQEVVTLQPWQNCVWIPEAVGPDSVFAAVLDASSSPVLQYSPTYPPGNVGFEVVWNLVLPSPEPVIPVDSLYQLIQYQVQPQTPYRESVWSLPVGPTAPNAGSASPRSAWQYTQSVPVYRFIGPASPQGTTPYVGLGQTAQIGFRLIDIYGNPLPDIHTSPFTPLYNDPLVAMGAWPGVSVAFYVNPAAGQQASLEIAATFDPHTLVVDGPVSPALSSQQPSAVQQWQAIQAKYFLILAQLQDPNVQVAVTTTLAGGPVGNASAIQNQLVAFLQAILVQIENAISTSSSPDYWAADSVSMSLPIPVPFSLVVALPADIFELTVSIAFLRTQSLVYPPALTQLPAVASVSYDIPADLDLTSPTSPPTSPGTTGIQAFATRFENAFAGFDNAQGVLKLAQRADNATGAGNGRVPTFWAVRWSLSAGIQVGLEDNLVYFAMRPLSTSLLGGTVSGRTFSNVDIDAWAEQFLLAFDSFLSPAMAVAVAILDNENGTQNYQQLLGYKSDLAKVIPQGLLPVFMEDMAAGDIAAAQDRFGEAILTTLGSAFSISTILQAPATISLVGATEQGSPWAAPPSLYGSVGPLSSGSPTASNQYTFSVGQLDLVKGQEWLTSLVSVAQPTEQSVIEVGLAYQVSYLQHEFQTEEMGYTPSSWLKFTLPEGAPLAMPITRSKPAEIPILLIFYPDVPSLVSQTAAGMPIASPPGSPQSIEAEIAAALLWNYEVQLSHRWAEQDQLFFDVTFNQTGGGLESLTASARGVQQLFNALATFQEQYPALVANFGSITKEAYSAPVSPPGPAQGVIADFTKLVKQVSDAWPDYAPVTNFNDALVSPPTQDFFFLQLGSRPGVVELYGHSETGGPPGLWPMLTVNGQSWQPNPGSPDVPVPIGSPPQNWYEADNSNAPFNLKGQDPLVFFQNMTLTWTGLDVREQQMASLSAFVVRNARGTSQNQTVNPSFIYTTETVNFTNPAIPLIQRGSLPPLTPDPAGLAATLDDILRPIAAAGSGLDAVLRISASYSYQLLPGPGGDGLVSSLPILLADSITMSGGSPGDVGASIGAEIARWYQTVQPSTNLPQLQLALTLFGNVDDQQLPLVEIDQIPILVGGVSAGWWTS
jgi:hypothetical protein